MLHLNWKKKYFFKIKLSLFYYLIGLFLKTFFVVSRLFQDEIIFIWNSDFVRSFCNWIDESKQYFSATFFYITIYHLQSNVTVNIKNIGHFKQNISIWQMINIITGLFYILFTSYNSLIIQEQAIQLRHIIQIN